MYLFVLFIVLFSKQAEHAVNILERRYARKSDISWRKQNII